VWGLVGIRQGPLDLTGADRFVNHMVAAFAAKGLVCKDRPSRYKIGEVKTMLLNVCSALDDQRGLCVDAHPLSTGIRKLAGLLYLVYCECGCAAASSIYFALACFVSHNKY